ncbi:resistance protein [Musa troglodytarum]|uniref:Resistance protein n=1 Tax=Musa troglodytarum TaxID=320322 RepID=A0A9E7IEU5_9LILI|nr:resistance protein [Musa troglodytarum]
MVAVMMMTMVVMMIDDDDDDGLWYLVLIGWLMVGKTSIARMVYHHPWVCQHFGRRVWIDGSKLSSFDATWVIKEFMRSIAGEPYEDVWLFYDRFGGSHRYFLILDHFLIGVDDQDELDRLEHFLLLMGEPGSLVMLILDADFADFSYLESRHSFSIHKIVPIKEDNWVKLLMRHALSHPDQVGVEEERMLVSFVDRLDHYFRSSPVYANVLGSIFRYTETSRWQEEIDAVCRTEPIEHNQHFNLMLLHYLSPISARQCLYQLLIPQDYIYGHADLLHVLATEGIPRKEQTKKTTSITLMNRDSTPVLFRLMAYMSRHAGLLHVLASEGIPRNEWRETQLINNALERCYFRMRVGRESTIPQQCLHLHLLVDSRASAFPTTLSAKVNNKLRTLYLRATRIQQLPHTVGKLLNLSYLNLSMSEIQVLPASLCNLRNLRVLNLTWCKKLWRLPGRIHNLRSLSIMKLAFCARLQRLPKSVISLANLQELDLEGCHSLIELPKDFHNLRKLTNLSMIKCHSLTRMPNELEQMHNLRMLFGYSINTIGSIEDVISKLQPLVSLEELDLWDLQVISNLKDASTPPMLLRYILPKLKRLALHWEWHNMNDIEITSNNVIWLHVLERLQPNIFLTRLEITSYAGKEFPRWIKDVVRYLYNLKEIRLVNLRRCESLPPLGRLVNLKIVEISGMDSITIVDETFRRLDKLIISEMPRLEKWAELRSPQNRRPATSRMLQWAIEELTLMQCPKLKQFELSYQRVSKLNVWLNNEMLWHCQSGGWQSLIKGIDELTIVGCQELRCLPPVLQSSREVSQLTIIRCNKLISLPDWLAEIGSLKSLFISGCTELTYIPPQLKTRSHLLLQLRGCPKLRF